jgi:MarR family transcriptional regulator for hemolysin
MQRYDYRNSIGFLVKSAAKAFETTFDLTLRNRVGITVSQSRVIGTLVLIKNGMTQKEIADRIGIEAATIVPIIDKMEELGMVERKPDPKDRRINLIFLTRKSEALWNSIVECALELEKISCNKVSSEELEITKKNIIRITQNLSNHLRLFQSESNVDKSQMSIRKHLTYQRKSKSDQK